MATAEQEALAEAISAALAAHPRVEAAWLAGSLGKSEGDAFSDVDVLALVEDGALQEVSRALAVDIGAIAEPALVNVLFGGAVLNVVTADWQRFDISLVETPQLERYDAAVLRPLFNRTGRGPPTATDRPPYRPDPEHVAGMIREFLRVLGLTPVVLGRREHLMAVAGMELLRRAAIELMLEDRRIAPWDRGGALHLNRLLTAEQIAVLEALPPVLPDRSSIIETSLAIAALYLPMARRLASEIGTEWPQMLEDATRRHLKARLGMEI